MVKLEKTTPKQKRLEREKQSRRKLIVEIAEKLFIEKSFDNTTIDEVAYDAGYTKATIYNYFESKNDLFAAVLANFYNIMFKEFDSRSKKSDLEIGLRSLADAYLYLVTEYPLQMEMLDSGRCTIINRLIQEKLDNKADLTVSEIRFKTSEEMVGDFIKEKLIKSIKNPKIKNSKDIGKFVKVLNVLNLSIRELIKKELKYKNSKKNTQEILSILFNIIDIGIANYKAE